jgi:hypothetical protein
MWDAIFLGAIRELLEQGKSFFFLISVLGLVYIFFWSCFYSLSTARKINYIYGINFIIGVSLLLIRDIKSLDICACQPTS